ncbi:MAG: hypothetical protein ACLGSD_14860 [Acidobacteriota bacterium]
MQLHINAIDYTAALDAAHPLAIERKLNEPSACAFALSLPANGSLAAPARMQSVSVTGDNGVVYFTGYIASTPMPQYAGLALEGPRYRYAIQAISDEILLDQALMPPSKNLSGLTAGALVSTLVTHTGSAAIDTSALTLQTPIASFVPEPGAPWSKSAGRIANQVRAAYRALSGALTLAPIPAAIHALNESDGTLTLANLALSSSTQRTLASDITVCGQHEPAAYVTEYFQGDGTTTQFYLAQAPYFPPAAQSTLIRELFNEPAIDTTRWALPANNNSFTLGDPGLTFNGGTGIDGQAQLRFLDSIEMGGTLLLEATGLQLANASTGILAAFFAGAQTIAGCIAGFQATAQQGTGAVSLQPIILGAASGVSYNVNPANQYALRIRIHCCENQRSLATYTACGDNGLVTTGGQGNAIPAKITCELQEFVNGVASMPVTLYDGSIAGLPVACNIVPASSLNLQGSMRAFNLTNLGSGWVVSTPSGGGAYTRRIGSLAESAECSINRTGKLVFYTGCIPAIGEQIAVTYRAIQRAVGRAAQSATPAIAWIGSVTNPPCRSSADCRNAAAALLASASANSALWSGTYKATQYDLAADVWPGDALALNAPSCNLNAQLIVRGVRLAFANSLPDLVTYSIDFANDWANDLAIHTGATVPADTWLPARAPFTPAANLTALTVTSVTGNSITVNTGIAAPTGGGFEVRRRDHAFMPGEDPGLVLRASTTNMTFARESANDRFYIRMYDGAVPPNYSEFSTALFLNLPLSS